MATLTASQPCFGSVVIYQDKVLCDGFFGKVCKAKYEQLPCTAEIIHDTILENGNPRISENAKELEQEYQSLKHPNIVQYLSICKDPQSNKLALLMEQMDENLTRFLERSTAPLPYHIQLNICLDVALALSYLHSKAIIHRDISSNNVILIGEGSRAKVTCFKMTELRETTSCMIPLKAETDVYRPPEALTTPPQYSCKSDCFSHGVLTIQTITKQFPNPGNAHQMIEDPRESSGYIELQIPEEERRKNDIDQVELDHPFRPIFLHCLCDADAERLSANEVCERLATLKREERYTRSVEQTRNQPSLLQTIQRELEQKELVFRQEWARKQSEHERHLVARESQTTFQDQLKDEKACHAEATALCSTLQLENVELQREKYDLQNELKKKEQIIEECKRKIAECQTELQRQRVEYMRLDGAQEAFSRQQYRSRVFYMGPPYNRDIHFTVTPHNDRAIQNYYKSRKAELGPEQSLRFKGDYIALDIPQEGIVLHDGWKLIPTTTPEIEKEEVDEYSPDEMVPHCELIVKCTKPQNPTNPPTCTVNILGTSRPKYFTINIEPGKSTADTEVNEASCDSIASPSESPKTQKLEIKHLQGICECLKNFNREDSIDLGLALGLHYHTLKGFTKFPQDMVQAWLLQRDSVEHQPTKEQLIKALEKTSHNGTAEKVKTNFVHT